ncbi:MAG: tetratricopeptide repeat protein [Candidatus Lokiarchaeota archaeon]|nr:tetratricopeptide repeat protein [Candidatus Lokiarchaeota archaeon]
MSNIENTFPEFIGREDFLSKIDKFLSSLNSHSGVFIMYGEGGIGKTTILLRLKKTLGEDERYQLSQIIDFSQIIYRTKISIMNQISKISEHNFENYKTALKEFHEFEREKKPEQPGRRLLLHDNVEKQFKNNLKSITRNGSKVVLFFDTSEHIFDTTLMDFILRIAKEVNNLLIIFAGRPPQSTNSSLSVNDFFHKQLRDLEFSKRSYQIMKLEGFDLDETEMYFDQSADGKFIDEEMRKKIQLLTNGNPIKIALAIEWLKRGIEISDLTEKSYSELEGIHENNTEKFNEISEQFEFELVDRIRILKTPIDDILLKMAHVHLRFNSELLNKLLRRDTKITDKKELTDLPFIKEIPGEDYFILHDEVTRLLNKYIWPRRDASGIARKKLNEEVVKYYDEKIDLLEVKYKQDSTYENYLELKSYEIERNYYQLGLDFHNGFKIFDNIFDEIRVKRHEELADLAVKIVKQYPRQFTPLAEIMLNTYYQGWVEVCRNDIDRAQTIVENGTKNLKNLFDQEYKDLSKVDTLLRNKIGDVYNLLGFCHRKKGNWKEAIENYHIALEELKKHLPDKNRVNKDNPDHKTSILKLSETLNNIANVQRFQGNLEEARHLCQISLMLRDNWGDDLLRGKSAYVMGMVLWELGGTAEAMKYLHYARQLFEEAEGSELFLAWIDRYEGYIHFRIGFPEDALNYIENAYTTFHDLNEEDYLAEVCKDLARLYAAPWKKDFPTAKKYATEALEYAGKTGNEYFLCECHLTFANIYFNEYQSIKNANQLVEEQNLLEDSRKHINKAVNISGGRYLLLESILDNLKGQIAIIEKTYTPAMEAFIKACENCLNFKTAFFERALDRLDDFLLKLATEDPTEALSCCDYGIDYWKLKKLDKTHKQLVDNLSFIKSTVVELQNRKKLQEQYSLRMKECQWEKANKLTYKMRELGIFRRDSYYANILYNQAAALRRQEKRSEARRICKAGISIFKELNRIREEGDGHYLLANIFWELGNTAEAAEEVTLAKKCYEDSSYELGLGYINRFWGYLYSRIGNLKKYYKYLHEAKKIFDKNAQSSELADIYNILGRVVRSEKIETPNSDINFNKAKNYAESALSEAKKANDHYRIAEAHLTLATLYYAFRHLPKKFKEFINTSWNYLERGEPNLSKNIVMSGIATGMQGNILFAKGDHDKAFEKLYEECKLSVNTKHMRLPLALELLTEKLMQLDFPETIKICDQLTEKWKNEDFYTIHNDLERVCQLVKEFKPYISEVIPKSKTIIS